VQKLPEFPGHNPTTQAESPTSTWYAFAGHVNNRRTPLMIGGKLGCRPDAIAKVEIALSLGERNIVDDALWAIARAVSDQAKVLRRIPEKMDPALYYKTFRPYIRFFENVFYEAMEQRPIADSDGHAPAMVRVNFRGETGAPCPR
jgi:hypothetical protein